MHLSPATNSLLASIVRQRPVVGRAAWENDVVARLHSLGACGEPLAAFYVGSLLLSPSDLVARAAGLAIHDLLWGVPSESLAELDRRARQRGLPATGLAAGDVERLLRRPGGHRPGVLALASLDRSGHVREAAVRALRDVVGDPVVGYLLLRANDWVMPVREAALTALRARLVPECAAAFLCHAVLILARADESRGKDAGLAAEVGRLLARLECREAFVSAVRTARPTVRRAAQSLVARATGVSEWAATLGLESDDAGVRLHALLHLVPSLSAAAQLPLLLRALVDPLPGIRTLAVEAWLRAEPDPAERERRLHQFLLDPSGSVRARARWHLGWRGGDLAAAWYRAQLVQSDGRTLAVVLCSLGETGNVGDATLLEPYLSHLSPRVVRSALRAWARLDPRQAAARLTPFLRSPLPGVGRTVRDLLIRLRPAPDVEEIRCVAREDPRPSVRRLAYEVLVEQSPWSVLSDFLEATGDADHELAAWARGQLEGLLKDVNLWRPAVPARTEVARVRQALQDARSRLPPSTGQALDFILRTTIPR